MAEKQLQSTTASQHRHQQTEQILYDRNQTARILGRSPYAIYMLYVQRQLPAVKHGRKLWFHIDDIRAFAEKREWA